MATLGIVVALGSRAMVHYTDCVWYQRSQHRHLPLPRKLKVRLCAWCKPSELDVRAAPPVVEWYEFSHSPGPRLRIVHMDMERAEEIAERRRAGFGRTIVARPGSF